MTNETASDVLASAVRAALDTTRVPDVKVVDVSVVPGADENNAADVVSVQVTLENPSGDETWSRDGTRALREAVTQAVLSRSESRGRAVSVLFVPQDPDYGDDR